MRNLGVEKVRHQPDLDPFQFASLDGLLNLAKISMFGTQDHAIHRVRVQEIDQWLDRCLIQIELGHNFNRVG